MGNVRPVLPGALTAGIVFADEHVLDQALEQLTGTYGPITFTSDIFDFTMTDYYNREMGEKLKKRFYCFERLIDINTLPDIKLFSNEVEQEYAIDDGGTSSRVVNIDPGYVTLAKLVLATTKDYSHRVYIGQGIYGEVTLRFVGGSFIPLENTYPDHKTPLAISFFEDARDYVKRTMQT